MDGINHNHPRAPSDTQPPSNAQPPFTAAAEGGGLLPPLPPLYPGHHSLDTTMFENSSSVSAMSDIQVGPGASAVLNDYGLQNA